MKKGTKKRTPTRAKHSTAHQIRLRAEREYIQDADNNTLEWHWEHGGYDKIVSFNTFASWSKQDNWVHNRIEYWRRIQERLLAHISDKILQRRKAELEEMTEVRSAVLEMLQPVRDPKTGKIVRSEKTGLPEFHVELPPYDRLVKAFLELDKRIDDLTVDMTVRATTLTGGSSVEGGSAPLLPSGNNMKLSQEEARDLARRLILKRNAEKLEGVIDAESETEDGDEKL